MHFLVKNSWGDHCLKTYFKNIDKSAEEESWFIPFPYRKYFLNFLWLHWKCCQLIDFVDYVIQIQANSNCRYAPTKACCNFPCLIAALDIVAHSPFIFTPNINRHERIQFFICLCNSASSRSGSPSSRLPYNSYNQSKHADAPRTPGHVRRTSGIPRSTSNSRDASPTRGMYASYGEHRLYIHPSPGSSRSTKCIASSLLFFHRWPRTAV